MRRLFLACVFAASFATPCVAGFTDFSIDFSIAPTPTISTTAELSYLLVAGTTDNLTTPGGDKITLPQ